MSITESHAKNRGAKLTADQKRDGIIVANRKAQMQWNALAGALTIAVVGAIVLISIFTEGELPLFGGHG